MLVDIYFIELNIEQLCMTSKFTEYYLLRVDTLIIIELSAF